LERGISSWFCNRSRAPLFRLYTPTSVQKIQKRLTANNKGGFMGMGTEISGTEPRVVCTVKHSGYELGKLRATDNKYQKTITLTLKIKPDPDLKLETIKVNRRSIKIVYRKKMKKCRRRESSLPCSFFIFNHKL
jgi:hypothetical protein